VCVCGWWSGAGAFLSHYIGTDLKLRTTLSCSEKVPRAKPAVGDPSSTVCSVSIRKTVQNHILGPLEKG
jgi:hypothetical protein